MSTTSITTLTRDSIYQELTATMLKEGNKHLLHRHYLLGKDWNKARTRFLYQYLALLSDFSCDVETYFNYKLKEELGISSDTIISTDSVIIDNAQYSLTIQKTDSVSMVEWFLKSLDSDCPLPQENISNTIYVNDDDLLPYTGTLENKITLYINSLGYEKEAIDSDIWVDYVGDSIKP